MTMMDYGTGLGPISGSLGNTRLSGAGNDPAANPKTPPAPPAQMSPAEQELVEVVGRRYRWSRNAKQPLLRTWATCLAFYVGEQYRQWDRSAKRLVEPKRIPSWRVLLVDNQVVGIVETAAAKLAKTRQIPRALPNTNEPEDQAAALAGTRALEHWWHVDRMERKELEANIQRIIFGATFYHDYWDPNKVARLPVPPQIGPFGVTSQAAQCVRVPVGDVSTEVLSVFDVFPEPVETWDDVSWVIIARRKPIHWYRETFGDRAAAIQQDAGQEDYVFEALMPGVVRTNPMEPAPTGEGMATLKVYYERPSRAFPRGRHAMIAGGVLLYSSQQLPMPHGELPLSLSGYRPVPKRLWPMGMVEHVLGQQRELNRAQSYLGENLRLHGRPKWLVPRGAGLEANAITSAPDELIEYNGAQPPEQVPPPGLPAWVEGFPAQIRTAIQQIAGQHEVTNAGVPTGVTAGVAIQLLQEQDDSRLAVPTLMGKIALQDLGKKVLNTIVERWREPRLLATLGRDQAQNIQALCGADIGDRDVLVETTEGGRDTDAQRAQRFLDYLKVGVFQMPLPLQISFLSALREQWLIDALEAAQPALQQQQAQQMAQQQAMAAAQSGGGPDPNAPPQPDPNQMMALAAQQQQAAAEQDQAAQEAEAGRQAQAGQQAAAQGHQLQLKQLELAHQADQAQRDRAHQLQLERVRAAGRKATAKQPGEEK